MSKRVYTLVIAIMVGVIGVITFQNNVEAMTNKDLAGKAYLEDRHSEGDKEQYTFSLIIMELNILNLLSISCLMER